MTIIVRKILKSAFYSTPLGDLLVVADNDLLLLVEFRQPNGSLATVEKRMGGSIEEGETRLLKEVGRQLRLYFSQKNFSFTLPMALNGTAFQRQVWGEIAQIPWGERVSYQEIAVKMGKREAVRAVGQAIGRNPISIVIPCHRVVRADGSLGGYAWGVERKEWLLSHERF